MEDVTGQFRSDVVEGLQWLGYIDPRIEERGGARIDVSAGVPAAGGVRMTLEVTLTAEFMSDPQAAREIVRKFNADAQLLTKRSS